MFYSKQLCLDLDLRNSWKQNILDKTMRYYRMAKPIDLNGSFVLIDKNKNNFNADLNTFCSAYR